MKLTIDEYNAMEGNACPFCESHGTVTCGSVDEDSQVIYRDNMCSACGRGWVEYFTVVEIVEMDL